MLILPIGLGWLANARSKSQKAWDNVEAIQLLCTVDHALFDRNTNPWWQKMLGIDMPCDAEDLSVEILEGPDETKQIQLLNQLRSFSKLRSLKIIFPFRSALAMAPLEHLHSLQQLTFEKGDSDGTDEDLLIVAKLPQLKQFDDFGFSRFSNLEALASVPTLENLSIDYKISDVDWSRFRALQTLRVANTISCGSYLDPDNHHDKEIARIAELQNLKLLELKFVSLSNEGTKSLAQLKTLKNIRLSSSVISDDGITMLAEIPSLETLEIESRKVSPELIEKWKRLRPEFKISCK